MNPVLTRTLIEKGIIKPDSELEAEYFAIDLSGHERAKVTGSFVIMNIIENGGEPIFEVASTRTGKRKRLTSDAILTVDGMSPTRLAGIYNIRPDGSTKSAGKRRGRKPKVPRPDET